MNDLKCRFGHVCTSSCQKDKDCPCIADHCCALTPDCEGCDDHYQPPVEPEDWEKEFDKMFTLFLESEPAGRIWTLSVTPQSVKDFISQTLSHQRTRLIERVEGMKKNVVTKWPNSHVSSCFCEVCRSTILDSSGESPYTGYNQALSDVLTILKEHE